MEIDPNHSASAIGRIPPPERPEVKSPARADSTEFSQTERLNQALRDSPNSRAEAVERAVTLIGRVDWPPVVVIRRIATLVATRIYQNPEA